MIQQDIKYTEDGDIDLSGEDFKIIESTGQHKQDILLADKGGFKEFPEIGVGAVNFIHDTDPDNFYRTVRRECSRDGMKVKDVKMVVDQLMIDAEYENGNS